MGSERRVGAGEAAVFLSGAYPLGKAFFPCAEAVDHVLRTLRRMDGGSNGHACQVEEVGVRHHLHFRFQQRAQLVAQGAVAGVDHVQLGNTAGPQLVEDLGEQFFLAGEMVVHRALGNARSGGDFVHAGDLEAVLAKFGNRRRHDGFAFTLGEAFGGSHGRYSTQQ